MRVTLPFSSLLSLSLSYSVLSQTGYLSEQQQEDKRLFCCVPFKAYCPKPVAWHLNATFTLGAILFVIRPHFIHNRVSLVVSSSHFCHFVVAC